MIPQLIYVTKFIYTTLRLNPLLTAQKKLLAKTKIKIALKRPGKKENIKMSFQHFIEFKEKKEILNLKRN